MENKLKKMFDYQRFENNAHLSALIQETEERFARELCDEDLFLVSAAGGPEQGNPEFSNNTASGNGGINGGIIYNEDGIINCH